MLPAGIFPSYNEKLSWWQQAGNPTGYLCECGVLEQERTAARSFDPDIFVLICIYIHNTF